MSEGVVALKILKARFEHEAGKQRKEAKETFLGGLSSFHSSDSLNCLITGIAKIVVAEILENLVKDL